MASILKHLRSSTADKRPTASGLADGQIALNTASGTPAMFFKDNAGNIVKVGPAHIGTTAPNVSPAGSAGNSDGELWIDESLATRGLKYYDGTAFINLTPSGTTSTVGLVELATDAETQAGTDNVRVVTPSGLQSKISDSTSTTSSTTIASSTAVKSAFDLANAALPKTGGTLTGELLISPSGSLVFEGSSDDSFETTIAVTNPTADRTITFPNVTGNVVTTGDSGTVTSTMILDDTIVNADINSAAAIAHSKLANITAGSVLLGNASNVPTATALGGDVTINSSGVTAISAGVIVNADVNASAAIAGTKISPDFGSQTITTTGVVSAALGAAATPSLTFTGDLNTGIYSPGADQVAISTGGSGRLFVDSSGRVGINTASPVELLTVASGTDRVGVTVSGTVSTLLIGNSNPATSCSSISFDRGDGSLRFNNGVTGSITERLRITSAGLVGVGTSSPTQDFEIARGVGTSAYISLRGNNESAATGFFVGQDSSGLARLFQDGNKAITFWTGSAATERVRIDSSGRVGVGVSSPSELLHLGSGGKIRLNRADNATGSTISDGGSNNGIIFNSLNNDGFTFQNAGTTVFKIDTSPNGNRVGIGSSSPGSLLNLSGTFGTNLTTGLRIDGLGATTNNVSPIAFYTQSSNWGTQHAANIACGNVSGIDGGGYLRFSTAADGSAAPAERMRLTSTGLGIGTTSPGATLDVAPDANRNLQVQAKGGTTYGLEIKNGTANSGGEFHVTAASSGAVVINRGSTEIARFNSTGLGIGTTSPSSLIHAVGTAANLILDRTSDSPAVVFRSNGTNIAGISTSSSNIRFEIGSGLTEAARIDSSGRLLVGTSSAVTAAGFGTPNNQFVGDYQKSAILVRNTSSDNTSCGIVFQKIRNTSAVQQHDPLGYLTFNGYDGVTDRAGAYIFAEIDAAPGSGDLPTRLVFSTTLDGGNAPTERMRIRNSGTIWINTGGVQPSSVTTGMEFHSSGYMYAVTSGGPVLYLNRNTSDGTLVEFRRDDSAVGTISVSGGTVSYNPFLGSHWGRLPDNQKTDILVGTILETVDQLIEWKVAVFEVEGENKMAAYNGSAAVGETVEIEYEGETYEALIQYEEDPTSDLNKHVCVKVNDTAGSKAVFGVFLGWDNDPSKGVIGTWNDMYCAAVGNYFVRMAASQEPEIGDLVEADGTGCGVVQDDDIIRTKTVAKITSTIPQVTYDDGSFLVTCVLCCG